MRDSLRNLLLLAAAALLALVIGDYFVSRSAERASPQALPVLPEDLSAQSQGWRWTQTTGSATRVEVSADDFLQGADGLTADLTGVILKIFRIETGNVDRVESASMRMRSDGSFYSAGETLITLGVDAGEGSRHGVEVTTSGVTFRPDANSASTDRRVEYRFADGTGSSLGATYDATEGILHMSAEARLERYGADPGQPSTTVTAGSLRYAEQGARMDLAGRARIEQGAAWLECESAVVSLSDGRIRRVDGIDARGGESVEDRQSAFSAPRLEVAFGEDSELERMRGSGGAEFASIEAAQRVEVRAESLALQYGPAAASSPAVLRRVEAHGAALASLRLPHDEAASTIESEALVLALKPGVAQIECVETLARGTLRQIAPSEDLASRELAADLIRMTYGPAGTLERLSASGATELHQRPADQQAPGLRTWSDTLDARFEPGASEVAELRQAGGFGFEEGARRGNSDSARFAPSGGGLELQGHASVADQGGSLSAGRIVLERASGRLAADGTVTGFLVPGPGTAGVFAGEQRVFLAAEKVVSDPHSQTLECRDNARLWQGRNRIDADSIAIDQATSAISAGGNVEAAWAGGEVGDADAPPLSIVRSESMRYEPQTGLAHFSGSVDLRSGGMRVLANELRTSLGEAAPGAGHGTVAIGSVRIAAPPDGSGHRAQGDRAEFGPVASDVVLTGQPAKILLPDGTESEGVSLTYRIAGDRLLVLGRGAERALTYRPTVR